MPSTEMLELGRDMSTDKAEIEKKWSEYEHLTKLYDIYLNVILKLGVFSFAIIGAITTYVLGKADGLQQLSLLFPLVLSSGLTYIFCKCYKPAIELMEAFDRLGEILYVELKPHSFLLRDGVLLFGLMYLITTVALIVMVVFLACGIPL